jgi:ADP-heptose:LPS heptosyltransferase
MRSAPASKTRPESAGNVLLIRLKSMGDVVLTLPAVNAVRENFPSVKITFLTSKENAPLLCGCREADEVIALDRAALRSGNPVKMAGEFFGLLKRLRAGKFSLVVDFQGYGETAWLSWFTGAPQRWGSVYGKGRAWAYTLGVRRRAAQHHAERNLAVLQAGGLNIARVRNEFALPAEALEHARAFFRQNNLDPARLTLFIQPFTSSPQKNWPLENYLAVAGSWQSRGWQIIFGGGPDDRARLAPALAGQFCTSAGVPLLVTGGLLQLCALVLGGDTGAVHLAVALGRRVVMIMESSAPGHAFPFQHPEWAVTPPPGNAISAISADAVVKACEQALAEKIGFRRA